MYLQHIYLSVSTYSILQYSGSNKPINTTGRHKKAHHTGQPGSLSSRTLQWNAKKIDLNKQNTQQSSNYTKMEKSYTNYTSN